MTSGSGAELSGELGATGAAPVGKAAGKVSKSKTYRCSVEPLAVSFVSNAFLHAHAAGTTSVISERALQYARRRWLSNDRDSGAQAIPRRSDRRFVAVPLRLRRRIGLTE